MQELPPLLLAAMRMEPGNVEVTRACLHELGMAFVPLEPWEVGVDVPKSSAVGWIALVQHMHV
jgi:hypothetical protein